jgi:hypothetical protein
LLPLSPNIGTSTEKPIRHACEDIRGGHLPKLRRFDHD